MSHTHFMFIVFMFLVRPHKSLAADTVHAARWISVLQPGQSIASGQTNHTMPR